MESNQNRDMEKSKEKIDTILPDENETEKLRTLFKNGNFDEETIKSASSIKVVIDALDGLSEGQLLKTLPHINVHELIDYINENETDESTAKIVYCITKHARTKSLDFFLNEIKSERLRAEILIRRDSAKFKFLQFVEDPYYRNCVLRANSDITEKDRQNIIEDLREYDYHKEKISEIEDDSDRARYIAKLEDNNMKIVFLSQVNDRKNRNAIIKSLKRMVDPQIHYLDTLVQKMIREYFEDMKDSLSEDQLEKIDIILNTTDISWKDFEKDVTHGRTYLTSREIRMSRRLENYINILIGAIGHEYGHGFSHYKYAFTGVRAVNEIEEGMADLFSELIINHYIEKHGIAEIEGIPIRLDKPYVRS